MTRKNDSIDDLIASREEFDDESKAIIDSIDFTRSEIQTLQSMKRTPGWKIFERKIREQLHSRIYESVKNDPKIQTLISLLEVTSTKSRMKRLEEEIASLLPE